VVFVRFLFGETLFVLTGRHLFLSFRVFFSFFFERGLSLKNISFQLTPSPPHKYSALCFKQSTRSSRNKTLINIREREMNDAAAATFDAVSDGVSDVKDAVGKYLQFDANKANFFVKLRKNLDVKFPGVQMFAQNSLFLSLSTFFVSSWFYACWS
jgi:hypothetical protein